MNFAWDNNPATYFTSGPAANPYASFGFGGAFGDIIEVIFRARNDVNYGLVSGYSIAVGTDMGVSNTTLCATNITATSAGQRFNISCPMMPGTRWVTIYATGASKTISVAEMQAVRGARLASQAINLHACLTESSKAYAIYSVFAQRIAHQARWLVLCYS